MKLQIPRKLKKYQILTNFQERVLYRSVSNDRFSRYFLPDFKREPSTIWCTSIIKSPDFNEIKEITDFSDSNEFSKESLIPFAVSSQKIVYFHIN